MTAYYVNDAATGAGNGLTPADAWTTVAAITVPSGTHTINFAEGSGPYFCDNWNGEQNNTTIELNGCVLSGGVDMNGAAYRWNVSTLGSDIYYLTLSGGGDPSLAQVDCATIDGLFQEESSEDKPNHQLYNGVPTSNDYDLVDIADQRLGWGDADTLGYSTLYVRDVNSSPGTMAIIAAQVTEVFDSNLRDLLIHNGIMEYANVRHVNSRQSATFTQTYRRIIFKFAGEHAVEFTGQGPGRLEFCLSWFAGHRFLQDNDIGNNHVLNCGNYSSHLFVIYGAGATAGTKIIKNCLDWGSFAGIFDAGNFGYTLIEDHNYWWPLLDQGTAMNYPDNTDVVWTATASTDVPANVGTGITSRAALITAGGLDPQVGDVNIRAFNLDNLKLAPTTPAKNTEDWWTAASAPNIGIDGIAVVAGGPAGPFGAFRVVGGSLNDAIATVVGNNINDGLRNYYLANGASEGSLEDTERQYLSSHVSSDGKSNQDMWMEYLASLGYTGNLQDRQRAFWGAGGGEGSIVRLMPQGSQAYIATDQDGTYVYGVGPVNSAFLNRWPIIDRDTVTSLVTDIDSLTGITDGEFDVLSVTPSGALLMVVKELNLGADTYFMFRSSDGGTTWGSYVMRPGWNGATHRADRSALGNSSFCYVTLDDGSSAILFGEYKTVSTNEAYVWISKDDGITWTVWYTPNASTTQNIRHIHSIHQDPVTLKIIVAMGDATNTAGLIVGPNSDDWSAIDDTAISAIANAAYDTITGGQQHRLIDIVFKDGFCYAHADAGATLSEAGIYKFPIDLSSYVRVYNPAAAVADSVIGGTGLLLANGMMIFADFQQPASTGEFIKVHASFDGTTFKTIGMIHMEDAHNSSAWFSHAFQCSNGDIYFGGGSGAIKVAGKGPRQSPVLRTGQVHIANLHGEEVLAPTYFVSSSGTDGATDGYNSPGWATMGYALTSSNMTNGGRLFMNSSETTAEGIFPIYNANSNAGAAANETIIELADGVVWRLGSVSTGPYLLRDLDEKSAPLKIMGGKIVSEKEGTFDVREIGTKSYNLHLYDIEIGEGADNTANKGLIRTFGTTPGCKIIIERCVVDIEPSTIFDVIRLELESTLIIYSSALRAATQRLINADNADVFIEIYNSYIYDYTSDAIRLKVACDQEPVIRNTEFRGANGTSTNGVFQNASALVLNDVNYILTSDGSNYGANSLSVGTDPKRNASFTLQSDSTLIGAGTAPEITYDLFGAAFLTPSSIGPAETI